MPKEQEFEGAIAVLDLMGFVHRAKGMRPSNALDVLIGPLVTAAHTAQHIVDRDLRKFFEFSHRPSDVFKPPPRLGFQLFADTLVLYLPIDRTDTRRSPELTMNTIVYSCSLLLAQSMWLNIPIRGAIAFGDCLVCRRPPVSLGQPFLEAHELQESQQWAGVALCESAVNVASNSKDVARLRSWGVELRDRETRQIICKDLSVVNWPQNSFNPNIKSINVNGSSESLPPINWNECFPGESPSVKRLRENTENFYLDHVLKGGGGGGVMFGPFGRDVTKNWRACLDDFDFPA